MKKQSKLLKVFSIILIVIGAISLLSGVFAIAMKSTMDATYEAMGIVPPTTFSYVYSIIGGLIILAAGIIGVAYKSRKIVLIIGIILAAYYVFNIIYAAVTTGFSAFSLVGLIWPLLYLWGWYLSE